MWTVNQFPATKDVAPERVNSAQKAAIAQIEKACATGNEWRCEVVTLFCGGQYHLYQYRRLQDIRLVFAPEDAIVFLAVTQTIPTFRATTSMSAFCEFMGLMANFRRPMRICPSRPSESKRAS